MRKFGLAFPVLILLSTGAFAETVLLYVGNSAETEEQFEAALTVSSALEDGVMNEFFDRGHIIFNAGIKMRKDFPDPPYDADRLPVRIAKAGGAGYLLEVDIHYSFEQGEGDVLEIIPVFSADYTFSRVSSDQIIVTGGVSSEILDTTEDLEPEKYSYVLGRRLAREALSIW